MKKIDCYRANSIWKKYVLFVDDRLLIPYAFSLKLKICMALTLFEREHTVFGFCPPYMACICWNTQLSKDVCECY